MGERDGKYSKDRYRDSDRGDRNYERRPKKVDESYIFGVRAVIEAIKADREINKILIQKGMNKELFLELKEALKGKNHQLQFVPGEKLDRITDQNHQGVIAMASPISYYKIEELVEELQQERIL